MKLAQLDASLATLLEPARFVDYCPNGLQLEGRAEVRRLVTGVTASLEFLRAAHASGADAVLVHHGWFWKGEDARITGLRRARIAFCLEHGISLFAYHLPLDVHAELGNNAQLGARLGFVLEGRAGERELVCHGRLLEPQPLEALAARLGRSLERTPLVIGEGARPVARIAWCTGGAQGYFEDALALGVDAYLTGEISEPQVHMARESGVAFIAAGHHATERYGVQAVGAHVAALHGLEHRFIDCPNPV